MSRLFIVRHGRTKGNKDKIFRGRWDLPLDDHGQSEVAKAGQALADVEIGAIYTSPMNRARQTASAVANFQGVEPQDLEALIDIDYGQWTKQADKDIAENQPKMYQKWKSSPHEVVFPQGEGLTDLRKRLEPALYDLANRHSDQNIVLVSHRAPIKIMLLGALGLSNDAFWKVQIDTASISAFDFTNNTFSLIFSNETCHLKSMAEKLGVVDF
jgi:probable phosphoglycerate mutase